MVFRHPDAIMRRMGYTRSHTARLLLAVRDLHEEIHAGFGQSLFAVRTLDGVSVSVRAGELVVLRGGVACGAASLVAQLAGTRPIRTGARIVAKGVRIRRGCISEEALRALVAGWSATPAITRYAREAPVVHVFYVRPYVSSSARPTREAGTGYEQWCAWAMALRAQGGGVLVHLPISSETGEGRREKGDVRPAGYLPSPLSRLPSRFVHESKGADNANGVRVLTLAAGRIVSADNGPIDPLHSP